VIDHSIILTEWVFKLKMGRFIAGRIANLLKLSAAASIGTIRFTGLLQHATALSFLACGLLYGQSPADNAAQAAPGSDPAASPGISKPTGDAYVIGADDQLAISVWKEPDISKTVPVRSDGKISLPLVGEVVAAGKTPPQLEAEITERLKSFITDPEVTVMVLEINSEKFNILGQVVKPGAYPLTASTTIVDAIAAAGGFRDFAKKKAIYILRKNAAGVEAKIAFNYEDYIKGKNTSQNVSLLPHDTIIVP
jgi:polysaccharide biosynthesis/export protein